MAKTIEIPATSVPAGSFTINSLKAKSEVPSTKCTAVFDFDPTDPALDVKPLRRPKPFVRRND